MFRDFSEAFLRVDHSSMGIRQLEKHVFVVKQEAIYNSSEGLGKFGS